MDTYNGLFTTYSLEQFAIIWTMDVYYLEMKLYIYWKWLYLLNVLMTMMLSITGTLTCCIQVMAIKIVLLRMSPSPMCVYNQHNASLQSTYLIMLVLLVTIFFLWHTCMPCHVLYYDMPLYNLACYCIVCCCMYLGCNSYSVHCLTKALISWCPFGEPSSNSTAVRLLCCLPSYYLLLLTFYIYCFLKMYIIIYISTVVRASSLKKSLA